MIYNPKACSIQNPQSCFHFFFCLQLSNSWFYYLVPPPPQSLLIHGRGRFNCSTSPSSNTGLCNSSNPECSPFVQTVIPGKTYRLRVASLTALSALSFQIEVIIIHSTKVSNPPSLHHNHLRVSFGYFFSISIYNMNFLINSFSYNLKSAFMLQFFQKLNLFSSFSSLAYEKK